MFRVTPFSAAQTALFQNRNHVGRLSRLQDQASSGLRYSRPSDDPLATNAIGVMNRSLTSLQTQHARIESIKHPLNSSVTHLLDANNLVTRAKQIALDAPQSYDTSDRVTLIAEMDSIIDRFMATANGTWQNNHLFSGNSPDTKPFDLITDSRLAIPSVVYSGSYQHSESVISESISIQSSSSGAEIFQHSARDASLFFGNTGAQPGTGTDSEIGRMNLVVGHTLTTYDAGSGIAAGSSSARGDTIIGESGEHSINIRDISGDGSSGTISLNGGPSTTWTSADNNLAVKGPQGGVVFVDTTAISANFDGDVEITASGTLSTDGGATLAAIDFTGNQVIHNEITGGVTNVDSTAIRITGTDSVEFQGTADALTVLLELRDDLENSRGFDDRSLNESFERRLADLERISNHLLDNVGIQSVALQDLEQLTTQNENHQLELGTRLAETESADLASVIVEMQGIQTTMQFNYAALSILQSNNILDFLG